MQAVCCTFTPETLLLHPHSCLLTELLGSYVYEKQIRKCTFIVTKFMRVFGYWWAGYSSRYSDWLRAGRSGDRIPVGARFSASVQTGSGAHPASCTMGTGSFPGVRSRRGMMLTHYPLLVPLVMKE
jgi:hypothetical protein